MPFRCRDCGEEIELQDGRMICPSCGRFVASDGQGGADLWEDEKIVVPAGTIPTRHRGERIRYGEIAPDKSPGQTPDAGSAAGDQARPADGQSAPPAAAQ